jgi:DNA-binding CsgD family transcriptional regulator
MASAVRLVDDLLELISACATRAEYEQARLETLERAIGFDALYVGAAAPDDLRQEPSVSGVSKRYVATCEANADRYWSDRLTLNAAAARAGGAVCDQAAFSSQTRDRMPFYREVISGLGIRAIALSVLKLRGQVVGCLYLGRTSRGARFGGELEPLERALPALALGERLYDLPPSLSLPAASSQAGFSPALTGRERQVLWHVTRGATNAQIAARLGSSPLTVKNQVSAILAKAGVENRTELVYLATRTNVESPNPAPAAK